MITVHGIPAHPLVVHAAVVLVPLAAALATAYAVWPARRWQTRNPAAVVSLVAAGAVQLAAMTGDQLKAHLHENTALIRTHEHDAGLLQAATWVLAGLVVLAWWALPHDNPLPDRDHRGGVRLLAWPVTVLVPLASVAVLVLVVLTGDAGARAVWGRSGRDSAAIRSGSWSVGGPRTSWAPAARPPAAGPGLLRARPSS
ncbi:MAG TPA: DUF2231 domain-containing protein [Nocardioides sp.]|jgi:hypothetical protein|uniref:DUF2231 domain-containing protein n=1 Tax=Nocardioides sp. TaxID=35761 RepID=UPI002E35837B|nr:DUF2231 domain-containing protein [Nocardioides sp.]HEX3930341.1 DUF2231 domain-containing protein [Nocardioides sp.]